MWPFPKITNNIVSVSYTPHAITCNWITPYTKQAPYILMSHQKTDFVYNSNPATSLHNPSQFTSILNTFLKKHHLKNAFVYLSVSGPQVVEDFVSLATASPQKKDFPQDKIKNCMWDFNYLYTNEASRGIFYMCGIKRESLAQFQLCAIKLGINLIAITTPTYALLRTYKTLSGPAFRHSKLAQDMKLHAHHVENMISYDSIQRLLHVPLHCSIKTLQEKNALAVSLGLFLLGTTNE